MQIIPKFPGVEFVGITEVSSKWDDSAKRNCEQTAFYFDIRKASLYCDRLDSLRRRAARTVINSLFDCLTAWLAPFICFTAEEAWLARNPDADSVHLRLFPDIPESWRDDKLDAKWQRIRAVRRVVTGALEIERAEKRIGSSLQASPMIHTTAEITALFGGLDPAELLITSGAEFTTDTAPEEAFSIEDVANVGVMPLPATGKKCERCFQILKEVGNVANYPGACGRCADATQNFQPLIKD